jgi:hypothetical protein
MTVAMLREELRKITGRQTLFLITLLGPLVLSLVIAVVMIVLYEVRDDADSIGGVKALGWFGASSLLGVMAMITLAAQEGSWDTANGTFRYLLLTGASRGQLYATRVVAVTVVAALVAAPVIAIGLLFAAFAPTAPSDEMTSVEIAQFIASLVLVWAFWAVLAHGIGSLTGSNGAAITFSFVVYFGAQIIGPLISHWSKEIQYIFPSESLQRLIGDGTSPLWLAIVVTAAWFLGAIWMGYARTQSTEY